MDASTGWRAAATLCHRYFTGLLREGLLAVHDRFLLLDVRRPLDRGDAAFEWEIGPRGPAGAY
jgi:hypothetical protein